MDYEALRKRMVEDQIIARGIKDKRVIDAFIKVERHKFVPQSFRLSAYGDFPLPIGEEQTISQPYIVALMTESLGLNGREKVLEIGLGSGYQAAILAELAQDVYSIERHEFLANKAKLTLEELGYKNIHTQSGDGTLGWQEAAPFDCIIVTAASTKVPQPLIDQLKDPGKLLIPLGEIFSQSLTLMEKNKGALNKSEICSCVFVPLIGRHAGRPM